MESFTIEAPPLNLLGLEGHDSNEVIDTVRDTTNEEIVNDDNPDYGHLGARPKRARLPPRHLNDFEVYHSPKLLELKFMKLDDVHRKRVV